jgi:hypothetical protein
MKPLVTMGIVTPAKAGVQGDRGDLAALGSRFRGNDDKGGNRN